MDDAVPLTREEIVPYWNAVIYGVCFYFLGLGLLKAALIVPLVFMCVALNYGARWVLRGGFAMVVLVVFLWIEVLPPINQWHDIIVHTFGWITQSTLAMR
jgi:hypothetical protein